MTPSACVLKSKLVVESSNRSLSWVRKNDNIGRSWGSARLFSIARSDQRRGHEWSVVREANVQHGRFARPKQHGWGKSVPIFWRAGASNAEACGLATENRS